MKKPLIILTGPTASGKTELSIALAKSVNGAVISADSVQVYKYMDIGSAKIRKEEMQGVPHYLIDELMPDDEFHVAEFQNRAKNAMQEIYGDGRIPILTGGTGFYIQAVLYDIDFKENDSQKEYRRFLEQTAKEKGASFLHQMLQKTDPKSAEAIHEHNVKRVIRALEFYHETGMKISEHNEEERQKESPYQFAYFVLTDARERLYEKIERRVDQMMEDGLLNEVRKLKEMGYDRSLVSMQALGYKEMLACLDGEISLGEAVSVLKRDTRHFAKRQLTWFKRERDVIWVDKREFGYDNDKLLEYCLACLREKNIIV
ncbi:tRNA (adenosine(37)-N6)-dimethylallyltransferase MiaA [bacterium C-53]|nr:tRNA (adenosine(37)-N6)-dimethylallyltransferase MiaA [Lachnospiraceae bacterium]NBI01915.1 tRNA (adenosine(37)-N6)-dimethylallyltransferase MiaA [Lachnospiraceae bacterium]RKJ12318.1 tRNA (adenosine(37)-N6)-dimethylallyltransferase MiaA [bacterium C-53]